MCKNIINRFPQELDTMRGEQSNTMLKISA